MSRGPDAGAPLERALKIDAQRHGLTATIREADWTRWSSATFTGARHELLIRVPSLPAPHSWIAGLPDAELSRPTMLVADLKIVAVRRDADDVTVRIEVLTLDE